jgi:hypothetical protein
MNANSLNAVPIMGQSLIKILALNLKVLLLLGPLTDSIFLANSITFGLKSNWLYCSSSEPDLIIIPLLFLGAELLTGFIYL